MFSDGTPLTAADVVGSWLRLLDPAHPSPLVALLIDIQGARAYLTGQSTRSVVRRAARERLGRRGRPGAARRGLPGDRLGADLRRRAAGRVARQAGAFGVDAVVSGGYSVGGGHGLGDHAAAQRALLGRSSRDPDGAPRPRHRRTEPGRRVRGRRPGLHRDLAHGCPLDRVRPDAGAPAALDARARADLPRDRHDQGRRSTTCAFARRSAPRSTGSG